jgi:hypothetical protein
MSQDQLRSAIDALRTRIQAEFDSQLNAIEEQQAQALDEVRRSVRTEAEAQRTAEIDRLRAEAEAQRTAEIGRVRAEADAHWSAEISRLHAEAEAQRTAEIDRVRAEWSARMDAALSQAAADADRRLADGIERTRVEVEEHAGARARLDLERALAQERGAHEEAAGALKRSLDSTTQDLESARTHAASLEAQLQALKTRLEDEQRTAREQTEAVARELRELTTARDELRGESDRSRE